MVTGAPKTAGRCAVTGIAELKEAMGAKVTAEGGKLEFETLCHRIGGSGVLKQFRGRVGRVDLSGIGLEIVGRVSLEE
jgi:hypothetical protein